MPRVTRYITSAHVSPLPSQWFSASNPYAPMNTARRHKRLGNKLRGPLHRQFYVLRVLRSEVIAERSKMTKNDRWQIPLNGSEAAAVASVKKQMKKSGLEPNTAGVRKLVRDVREKSGN